PATRITGLPRPVPLPARSGGNAGSLAPVALTPDTSPTVAEVAFALEQRYPPEWAEDWDRVGLVLGEPSARVDTVLCVVDCVPETVAQALEIGAQMIVAHHPLLLRGVSSVAPTTYQGRIVHDLIKR